QGLTVAGSDELYVTVSAAYRSSLTLRTSRPAKAGAVYRYAPATGFEWFAPEWGPLLGTVDVSADGKVVGVNDEHTTLVNIDPKRVDWVTTYTSRIIAPGVQVNSLDGRVQVSRNGRYALV